MYPGDLAGGFSDLEMTWLLYCAGAATADCDLHLESRA